jgi:hypothetical protein
MRMDTGWLCPVVLLCWELWQAPSDAAPRATRGLTCHPACLLPAGYQYRRTYQAFLDNFWQLLPAVRQSNSPADKRAAALLRAAGISDYKLGHTKVFLRWAARTAAPVALTACLRACLPACLPCVCVRP